MWKDCITCTTNNFWFIKCHCQKTPSRAMEHNTIVMEKFSIVITDSCVKQCLNKNSSRQENRSCLFLRASSKNYILLTVIKLLLYMCLCHSLLSSDLPSILFSFTLQVTLKFANQMWNQNLCTEDKIC